MATIELGDTFSSDRFTACDLEKEAASLEAQGEVVECYNNDEMTN